MQAKPMKNFDKTFPRFNLEGRVHIGADKSSRPEETAKAIIENSLRDMPKTERQKLLDEILRQIRQHQNILSGVEKLLVKTKGAHNTNRVGNIIIQTTAIARWLVRAVPELRKRGGALSGRGSLIPGLISFEDTLGFYYGSKIFEEKEHTGLAGKTNDEVRSVLSYFRVKSKKQKLTYMEYSVYANCLDKIYCEGAGIRFLYLCAMGKTIEEADTKVYHEYSVK